MISTFEYVAWLRRDILFRLPGIVGTDSPHVTFQVAAGETATTIGFVFNVEENLAAGSFDAGIDGIGIVNDQIVTARFNAADLVRLLHVAIERTVCISGADHDHPAA